MSRQPSWDKKIRKDIAETIRKAFPEGHMPFAVDIQKSYIAEVFPRLKKRLLEIDDAAILFERDPLGGRGWSAGDGRLPADPRRPRQKRVGRPTSYYLFFTAPSDGRFELPAEPEGTRTVGYSVALSVMAPVALVVLNHMTRKDALNYVPDIAPETIEGADGKPVGIEDFCRRTFPEEALRVLRALSDEIGAVLDEFGVKPLPEEEQLKPVEWLGIPALTMLGRSQGVSLSVRDAFFFWGM